MAQHESIRVALHERAIELKRQKDELEEMKKQFRAQLRAGGIATASNTSAPPRTPSDTTTTTSTTSGRSNNRTVGNSRLSLNSIAALVASPFKPHSPFHVIHPPQNNHSQQSLVSAPGRIAGSPPSGDLVMRDAPVVSDRGNKKAGGGGGGGGKAHRKQPVAAAPIPIFVDKENQPQTDSSSSNISPVSDDHPMSSLAIVNNTGNKAFAMKMKALNGGDTTTTTANAKPNKPKRPLGRRN